MNSRERIGPPSEQRFVCFIIYLVIFFLYSTWRILRAMGSACIRMANQSRDPQLDNGLSIPSFLCAGINPDRSLPTGVLIEILTRLPVKTLVQCQLVCKDWQTLIQGEYFKEMHLDRSEVVSHWHNRARVPRNDPQFRPNPDPFIYCHGCNGLLLLMRKNEKKYYVWNPAIRRHLEVPNPQESSKGFAFTYVPATKSYKIVSFYEFGKLLRCEVITPGDNVWRPLKLPKIGNKNSVVKREAVVRCGGAAHYVLVTEAGEFPRIDILSLDLEKESFAVSRFPDLSREWKNCWELDWDGKLGFADVVGENLEVMVLEDYKSGRWCEKKRVVYLDFLNKSMMIPLYMEKGEICFWLKEEKIFRYTIKTGRCTDCGRESSLCLSSKLYPHKPSLFRLEGMVPDNPRFDRLRSCFQY